jgi:dipeptidyl-peptidase-4
MAVSEDRAAFDAWLNLGSLIKGGRVAANWAADGGFSFTEGAPDNTTILSFDPKSGKTSPLFDTAKVRETYRAALGRDAPGKGLPFDAAYPAPGGFMVTIEGKPFVLAADGSSLTSPPQPNMAELVWQFGGDAAPRTYKRQGFYADNFQVPEMLSPNGRWYSSIRDHDVWVRSTTDSRLERLTFDGEPLNGWDVETSRQSIAAGNQVLTFTVNPWSPTSYKLFVTRFDERGTEPWVRTRFGERSDEVEHGYFARAGERLPTATPHFIDTLSRKLTPIDVPVEDRFLAPLGWNADGTKFFFVQFSRDISWAGVWRVDAETAAAELLFEEKSDTFLRIQHQTTGGRTGCHLLPDGGFLWESDRTGWMHLYRYDAEGKLVGAVTSGDWPVMDVQAIDSATGFVYFTAHPDQARPYDVHLCRAPLAGGKVERLTDGTGMHEVQFAPDRSYFIDTVSRPDAPPQSFVRRVSGEVVHTFPPADTTALEAVGWTPAEEFSVKAADGETDLWGVMYKPRDFDPSKSYPVIEHIYAGPQLSNVPHYFSVVPYQLYALNQALPQLGYIVVIIDARGTPERSKAFLDVTYKDWRWHVTDDHAAAMRNLAKDRPYIDLNRVGMWGHSWGGYYTLAHLFDKPDLYRAGICSAPGFDPYDAFIYEPYLGGVPAAHNQKAYDDAYLFTDAHKLKGDLMIVAGSKDASVWQSSMRMTDALIRAGKPHEFVAMPGQYHMYASLHDNYFLEKLISFFDRTVKNAPALEK